MRRWLHEWLFRRPSREDSRRRRTRDLQEPGGARTFGVSLSSVKRYVNKADRGESLAPKKSPGSAPKLDEKAAKLLEADLKQRPFANLRERRDYIHALMGLSVSRSTICRAIARLGSSRKKGDD
jgi:transposase